MAAPTEAPRIFKLVFAGEAGAGKTTLLKRHITGEFYTRYTPTMGVEVHPIAFETSKGPIVFNCWDTAGQEKLAGLRDGYYIGADAAAIFLTGSPRIGTMQERATAAAEWASEVRRVAGRSTPVVYCLHRCDESDSGGAPLAPLAPIQALLTADPPCAAFETSAKTNYNFEKPFLWAARQLLGDPELVFKEGRPRLPPTVNTEVPLGETSDSDGDGGAGDSDSGDEAADVHAAFEALEEASGRAGITISVALLMHHDAPGCRVAAQRAAAAVCEELGSLSADALRSLAAAVAARGRA